MDEPLSGRASDYVLCVIGKFSWPLKSPLTGSDLKLCSPEGWCHWLDSMIKRGYGTHSVTTSWLKPSCCTSLVMQLGFKFQHSGGTMFMIYIQMCFQAVLCNQLGLQAVTQYRKELQALHLKNHWLSSAIGWGYWLGSTVR